MRPLNSEDLKWLAELNAREATYDEVQQDLDALRQKYLDVPEIQLRLDRRQVDLDRMKKNLTDAKSSLLSSN